MCDLWRNTSESPTPSGAIPRQIELALAALPACLVLKLYNSGSFFDPRAVPRSDWREIARLGSQFERVIVECHPRLVTGAALEFAELLGTRLEIAMGLETVHEKALEGLNKRFVPRDFANAAAFLRGQGLAVRTFLLVHPPFLESGTELAWLEKSMRFAFEAGSEAISLIPLRHGNGAIEELAREPGLAELEEAHETGLNLRLGRVFADTWDLARFAKCQKCVKPRTERLARMNLAQRVEPRVRCSGCA